MKATVEEWGVKYVDFDLDDGMHPAGTDVLISARPTRCWFAPRFESRPKVRPAPCQRLRR